MEPKPENSWSNKISVKKGDIGENLVRNLLERKGWIVYAPETSGAHAFDRLCVKDKKEMIIVEIKTKARMTKYRATGFNTSSLKTYKDIQEKHGVKVVVAFVDEGAGSIYGNELDKLLIEVKDGEHIYPKVIKDLTVFSLDNMVEFAKLSEEDIRHIKSYTVRNYDYARAGITLSTV